MFPAQDAVTGFGTRNKKSTGELHVVPNIICSANVVRCFECSHEYNISNLVHFIHRVFCKDIKTDIGSCKTAIQIYSGTTMGWLCHRKKAALG